MDFDRRQRLRFGCAVLVVYFTLMGWALWAALVGLK